jgi:hypothetical protein
MGDDIFIGDLEKEITLTDGVLSLIDLRIHKIWNGGYSPDKCPLPELVRNSSCDDFKESSFVIEDAEVAEIDLEKIDRVLYGDYNSMYEIKNPVTDIQVKCKIR